MNTLPFSSQVSQWMCGFAVFCYCWQCCYEYSCMWLLEPTLKIFSGFFFFLNPKVYSFSTCPDNVKLNLLSLICSSFGSIRSIRNGLWTCSAMTPTSRCNKVIEELFQNHPHHSGRKPLSQGGVGVVLGLWVWGGL